MSQRNCQIFVQFRALFGLFLVIAPLLGCSSSQPMIPNPFNTADRVPPPIARTPAAGTAQPYYPANATPGAVTLPPGAVAPNTIQQQTLPSAPYSNPGVAPAPTFQNQPYGATTTNSPAEQIASTPGDTVAIPTDSTSLRFGSTTTGSPLKTQPSNAYSSNPQIASAQSLPATANSWVSGAAPVRTQSNTLYASNGTTPSTNSLRVRVPGGTTLERQPVDVASLQSTPSQVKIQSLPANDPNATVGWR